MAKAQRKEDEEKKDVPSSAPAAAVEPSAPETWQAPAKIGRKSLYVILGVVALFNLPMIHYFLLRSPISANQTLPFRDDYSDPATVAQKYNSTGGLWRVVNGELLSPGVKNNPLWLRANLPNDVRVEFDVRSMSPEGDIKVEIFGDGSDHASGYVLIHGGWNNSISIIARRGEPLPRGDRQDVPLAHRAPRQGAVVVHQRRALHELRRPDAADRQGPRSLRVLELGSAAVLRQPHRHAALK
jgi:hypothetical protein